MPIYQYVCSKCNTKFEVRQSFNDENIASCPSCKCESRRLFVPVPIIFKGSGFYVTDSKSSSPTQLPAKMEGASKEVAAAASEPTEPKKAIV
ncbi:MAG: zinc ribbon domain-containing protein [Dehalococcoidia bacterium]|nr:zinc ribbon domain-containing protein [Dehalococcoidia bacterium]